MKDELKTRAKIVRNDLFKHLTSQRHLGTYPAFFDPSANAGTAEQEAGPVPKNWDEWTQSTLREGRWIDGLSILAASKRYGICIVVVPCSGCPKDRPMKFGEWRERTRLSSCCKLATINSRDLKKVSSGHFNGEKLKPLRLTIAWCELGEGT